VAGDWRVRLGLLRSLLIYWRPGRQAALRQLYAPFAPHGTLTFDIGAHVGDRMIALADVGTRVVAVEPQPQLQPWLRHLAARRAGRITLVEAAVGAEPGTVDLAINRGNPTVSSASPAWRAAVVAGHPGFRGQTWDAHTRVPVTTLAELIRTHGEPAFCKIDVEGFEAEVLAGLDRPLPALSFEFVAGALDIARACVERLEQLGTYDYNMIIGERRQFAWAEWQGGDAVRAWLDGGAGDVRSGDLYARRRT
jgi:FkbM family methyltransferase